MDSSNISEDGVSERVRFDNTVCYVIDGKRDCPDSWYMAALEQVSFNIFFKKYSFAQ